MAHPVPWIHCSTLPYGNTVYHLSVTLSSMANPAAAFSAFFFPTLNVGAIYALSLLGSALAGFILATALYSPEMIGGQTLGGTLVVQYRVVRLVAEKVLLTSNRDIPLSNVAAGQSHFPLLSEGSSKKL